ncbi:MAG: cytochrome c biogenesis protein ResB, partial [Anaerolineae bacterium]
MAGAVWRVLSARSLSLWLLLALAFLSALGTLFPQRPPGPGPAGGGAAEWEVALQARYGPGLASLFSRLGILDLYHTPLFRAVLAALVVNGLACTLARVPSQWRVLRAQPRPAPPPEPFPPGVWTVRVPLPSGADAAEVAVREACQRVGLRPRVERLGGAVAVVAERGRWTTLGSLVGHLALLAVAVGLVLAGAQGTWARTPPLTMGQEYPLPWSPDLALRVQEFRIERYSNGRPRAYFVQVAVAHRDGGPGAAQMLQLGVPASLPGGGLAFFYGYGPAVRLDVYGADGGALLSGASLPLAPSATLPLPDGTSLVVERGAGLPDQYHVQRWESGALVAEVAGQAEVMLSLGDLSVRIAPDWYVVLEVARDPGFPWVVAGVIAALAGAGVALGGRWRQVRGFWREGELLLWTRGAGAGSLGARAWQRLVREMALAGGGKPV